MVGLPPSHGILRPPPAPPPPPPPRKLKKGFRVRVTGWREVAKIENKSHRGFSRDIYPVQELTVALARIGITSSRKPLGSFGHRSRMIKVYISDSNVRTCLYLYLYRCYIYRQILIYLSMCFVLHSGACPAFNLCSVRAAICCRRLPGGGGGGDRTMEGI